MKTGFLDETAATDRTFSGFFQAGSLLEDESAFIAFSRIDAENPPCFIYGSLNMLEMLVHIFFGNSRSDRNLSSGERATGQG